MRLVILSLVCYASIASAGLFCWPDNNAVYLFVKDPIRLNEKAIIQRQDGKGLEWVCITPDTLQPVYSPEVLKEAFGINYSEALRELGVSDEVEVWQKMLNDPFSSAMLSFRDKRLSKLFGRITVDTTVESGRGYKYRIVRFYKGATGISESVFVKNTRRPIPSVSNLRLKQNGRQVFISFDMPPLPDEGEPTDPVVGFQIERRVADNVKFINNTMILRSAEARTDWSDDSVEIGLVCEYRILGRSFWGEEIPISEWVSVEILDNQPPLVVRGITPVVQPGGVALDWEPSIAPDLKGYHVYRSTDPDKPFVKLTVEPVEFVRWFDSTAVSGLYYYGVTAIDMAGNESANDEKPSIILKDTIPPEPVDSLKCELTKSDRQIRITWNSSPSADLLGYVVYRSEGNSGFVIISKDVLKPLETSFVDSGATGLLNEGVVYSYKVEALDKSRNRAQSKIVRMLVPDKTAPQAPSRVLGEWSQSGKITLSWDKSVSPDGDYYIIDSATVIKDTVTIHRWKGSAQKAGVSVVYGVRCADRFGNVSGPTLCTLLVKDTFSPNGARSFYGEKREDGVYFSWEPSSSSDVVGYSLYFCERKDGVWLKTGETKSGIRMKIKTPKKGFYQIRAFDASRNESISNETIFIQ